MSSNYCFLFEKYAREAASLEASGHVHRDLFSCWWVPFFLDIHKQHNLFSICDATLNDLLPTHYQSKLGRLRLTAGANLPLKGGGWSGKSADPAYDHKVNRAYHGKAPSFSRDSRASAETLLWGQGGSAGVGGRGGDLR